MVQAAACRAVLSGFNSQPHLQDLLVSDLFMLMGMGLESLKFR